MLKEGKENEMIKSHQIHKINLKNIIKNKQKLLSLQVQSLKWKN